MTHDPWQIHAALTCPACHVTGKVVTNEADEDDDWHAGHEAPYVCVDCGASWLDQGVMADVKDYRVNWARLVEGRPYEPPKPAPRDPNAKGIILDAFDSVLRDYYSKETAAYEAAASAWMSSVLEAVDAVRPTTSVSAESISGLIERVKQYGGEPPNAAIVGRGLVRIIPDPNIPPGTFVVVRDIEMGEDES